MPSKTTPKNKLFISDERMIALMRWAIETRFAETEKEYLAKIGFTYSNITNVRRGTQSFTNKHILIAAKETGANINWIFGLEDNLLRSTKKRTPKQMLREAVEAVERHLK